MIEFRQKQFAASVLGAGLANIGAGVGTAVSGVAKGAAMAGKGLIAGAVPATIGTGQVAATGLAAGSLALKKAALWGASHPLILGGLAAYGIYKLLKRRRERRMQERGYSVIEKMYSSGELNYKEKNFVKINNRAVYRFVDSCVSPEARPTVNKEVLRRINVLRKSAGKRQIPNALRFAVFSDVSDQLSIPMPTPKAPRELVPKKIVKKAKKSGVVQKDSDGNWRIINMNAPQGPIYWKNSFRSKEAAENCLRAYQSGRWNKK